MCDKCQELEKKIERYRRLAFSINDRLTIDRFDQLIKDAEAEKAIRRAQTRFLPSAKPGISAEATPTAADDLKVVDK